MKSILLASTSVVAFAGAAAAEITWGGDVTLGYNDNTTTGNDGFYFEAGLTLSGAMELDNGLTAGFEANIGMDDGHGHLFTTSTWIYVDDFELFLTSDNAGLYFGSTETATEVYWDGVDGSEVDGFDEFEDNNEDAIIRGEVTFGSVTAALSYQVDIDSGPNSLEGLQFAAVADLGNFNVILGYQDTDNTANDGETIGLSVGTSFSGADVMLTYLDAENGDSSIGASVSYPVGPVVLGAFYTSNKVNDDSYGVSVGYDQGPVSLAVAWESDQGVEDWSIEGSYDVGNGLMVMAGVTTAGDDYYIAGEYDLGGGAALLVSYAEDDDNSEGDEIGDPEYQKGTTVEVSFEF